MNRKRFTVPILKTINLWIAEQNWLNESSESNLDFKNGIETDLNASEKIIDIKVIIL